MLSALFPLGRPRGGRLGRVDESTGIWLQRARAGDTNARGVLLARQIGRLRAFVRPRLGSVLRARETSADLVQSVLREAFAGFDRARPGGVEAFRGWLFRQAERKVQGRGRFWSRLRRSAAREVPLDEGEAARRPGPSTQLVAREELERLERAFAVLPPAWRQVIVLARVQGLSHAEVARRTGRSESATRTLLSRALARLATTLESSSKDSNR